MQIEYEKMEHITWKKNKETELEKLEAWANVQALCAPRYRYTSQPRSKSLHP